VKGRDDNGTTAVGDLLENISLEERIKVLVEKLRGSFKNCGGS